ncbi:Uncharacterized protein OS=mine drainage metagenome GN=CARN2_3110 PE=4 SV=1 [Gemmata massiliana]|uniref:Histone H1 n=1 Tax=Gemmata massiliana TaxID=1210884 RepID=A0A6P2D9M6_9BACT|nr:histone H1 [Gemmata massiliana]VTR97879.1 Uncharacterized protein OS=mine drainage metagenome GN=CARN2_3110 PE=4 SV=1 [Gemmata massiliana]
MAKSPKKKPAAKPKTKLDLNQLAARIVAEATGAAEKTPDRDVGKDPSAVARGAVGGLKGGKARAKSMTKKQRTASAKKASAARWGKEGASDAHGSES